jgi:hypothetical protein
LASQDCRQRGKPVDPAPNVALARGGRWTVPRGFRIIGEHVGVLGQFEAERQGVEWRQVKGAKHDTFWLGSVKIPIPRHAEIGRRAADH